MRHSKLILLALVPALALALGTRAGALTVRHLGGTTEIVGTPKRIVVLEFGFMDALARLGVKPVGVAADGDKADEILPYLRPYYPAGTVTVGSRAQPSLEKILALKPDLIIADEQNQSGIYEQLNKIAPTLLFRSYRGTYRDQLEQFQIISRIVGREAAGRTALRAHQNLLDRVKATVRPEAGRVVVGVLAPTGFFVHSDKSFLGSLMEALGRDNPALVRDGQTQYPVSLEGLVALDPDTLIVLYNDEDRALFEKYVSEPLVRATRAGRAGRVYAFNRDLWAKGRGLIGLDAILADMSRSGVLSGQPAK